MNDAGFDHLARVASIGSRRACLRALLGALLAGGLIRARTAAQQLEGTVPAGRPKEPAALPLGSPCEVDAQCAIDHADAFEDLHDRDPAPICGDNGMTKDGLGNCCKPAGEFAFCRRDADCCDEAVCVGIKLLGTICSRTDQLDLGMSCTRTADCYGQTAGFNMLCDANGAGQRVCCVNGGGFLQCHEDGHCCGTALCVKEPGEERGLCLDPVDGGLPLGAACTEGGLPCSQTGGSTICADNGDWYDFDRNCCRTDGGLCRQDHDCCAGFICLMGRAVRAAGRPSSGATSVACSRQTRDPCRPWRSCSPARFPWRMPTVSGSRPTTS